MSGNDEVRPKPFAKLQPNIADFGRSAVVEATSAAVTKKRLQISSSLDEAARVARSGGDETSADALQFLAAVMQPMLSASDVRRPYHPYFEYGDRRGIIPDDFSERQIDIVKGLLTAGLHPCLMVVLHEIIWLRCKDRRAAIEAIRLHLLVSAWLMDDAEKEDRNYYVPAFAHIERSARLCKLINLNGETAEDANTTLLSFGPKMLALGEHGMFLHAEELVLELRLARTVERAQLITDAATSFDEGHSRKEAWLLAAQLYGALSQHTEQENARLQAAETMVSLAEMSAGGEDRSFMVASTHLSEALKILRQVPSAGARRDVLRVQLEDYQQKMRSELNKVETEMDLSEDAERAIDFISGRPPADAIAVLGFMAHPSHQEELQASVWELADQYPMQYLISISVTDEEGRTIAVVPSLLHNKNEKEAAVALRYHMFNQAEIHYQAVGAGIIEPARRKLCEEHHISEEGIGLLVRRSLFVPEGHEGLFKKGIFAGLNGDFGVALQILVPQLENALREFAKRQGDITSTKEKSDKIEQEALTLGPLLEIPSVRAMLTDDVAFDLECLLTDRLGLRLRHQIAHGQVSDGYFEHTGVSRYLFGLILKLVVLPLTKPDL